ncbi:MAG: pantetheine-phosphate adenylyltransferase [Chloroflexi bacterium]|nr:pantetheine-phosphate adenylyltransferase [Chloroflexota bacterium]
MVRAFFPGTFDPVHYGHIDIARRASRLFDELIVAVYDKPLKSLLFSPEERIALVEQTFNGDTKVKVIGYSGLTVDACRRNNSQVIVRGLRVFSDFEFEFRMALANHRLAPDIEMISLITAEEHTFLSSGTVREIATLGGDVSSMVPPHVERALVEALNALGDHPVPPNALRD